MTSKYRLYGPSLRDMLAACETSDEVMKLIYEVTAARKAGAIKMRNDTYGKLLFAAHARQRALEPDAAGSLV